MPCSDSSSLNSLDIDARSHGWMNLTIFMVTIRRGGLALDMCTELN